MIAAGVYVDSSIALLVLSALAVAVLLMAYAQINKRWPKWGSIVLAVWLLLSGAGVYSILKVITGW